MHVMELLSLKGKVALVTGGAGKYGSQITRALAEAGATVITASRTLEKNEAFAAELRAEGYEVYGESYDQSSEESIVALRDRLLEKYKRLDVLVNNSVTRGCFKGGFHGDSDGFARSLDINGRGFFVVTRTFGKIMEDQGFGSIINIGSYMGMLGPNQNLYAGTGGTMGGWGGADYYYHKGGMHQFTRFLAAYYGEFNVRCNCLSLGGLFNNQHPAFVEEYSKACYIHRLANNDDIKGIIVYLASDASQYTTGTVIPVDGGYSAR